MNSLSDLQATMALVAQVMRKAIPTHEKAVTESAAAQSRWREERAKHYLKAEGPVGTREAEAEAATAGLRYEALLREGLERSALEAIKSYRQELSALQSVAAAFREEAKFERTEGAA